MNKKKTQIIIFIITIGFILWITLISRKPYTQRIFRPDLFYEFRELFIGNPNGLKHTKLFLENILLFMPFGLFFPWKKRWWIALIMGCLFSIFIELAQYVTMLGELEFDDVIANSIGTLMGLIVNKVFIKIGHLEKCTDS